MAGFAERVDELGTEAAQLEWLQLLRGAAAVGDSQDLTKVMVLKRVYLSEPLALPLLLEVLDLVPCFHERGVAGAAEVLLRHCLGWANLLDPSVWPLLVDRLQQACQPVSKQVETELQDMFLRLLGEDGTRLLMARAGGWIGARLAVAPIRLPDASVQSDAVQSDAVQSHSVQSTSLFMKLPRELRLAFIRWIIPQPQCLHHAQAVRQHGATLTAVCHGSDPRTGCPRSA